MFEVGREYRRRDDIHGPHGGQQQGGISTPKDKPFIFLFTGGGEDYGYGDDWKDGIFHYSGEGQVGPMEWAGGNRAIRDHVAEGKDLHLFKNLGKGRGVRYIGQFVCSGWHEEQAKDREGGLRRGFIFHLVPLEQAGEETGPAARPSPKKLSLDELRKRALQAAANVKASAKEARRVLYERSQHVRDYVLARADGTCEACEAPAPFQRVDGSPYLEPHHTRRLSDGGPDDPRWVAGLCPTCHRRVHYGVDGAAYNAGIETALKVKEPP